jgi:hypothetical protein
MLGELFYGRTILEEMKKILEVEPHRRSLKKAQIDKPENFLSQSAAT